MKDSIIHVRTTKEEKEYLKALAKMKGYKNLSELITDLLFNREEK